MYRYFNSFRFNTNKFSSELFNILRLAKRTNINCTIAFCWVPSHVGFICENERANKVAKNATVNCMLNANAVVYPLLIWYEKY